MLLPACRIVKPEDSGEVGRDQTISRAGTVIISFAYCFLEDYAPPPSTAMQLIEETCMQLEILFIPNSN